MQRSDETDRVITSVAEEVTAASEVVSALAGQAGALATISDMLIEAFRTGGTVFLAGNGGSAADAQHLAAELAGRFLQDRRPLPAVAITTNTSVLTAVANDYGFDEVFARQVEAQARGGDVVVLISTSGASPNIVRALDAARKRGCAIVVLTGRRGRDLAARSDAALVVDSEATPRIQEAHIVAGHVICGLVEAALGGT